MHENQYKIRGLRLKGTDTVVLYVEAKASGLCVSKMQLPEGTDKDGIRAAADALMQLWLMGVSPSMYKSTAGYIEAPRGGLLQINDPALAGVNEEGADGNL